jgi:F0F1-type ATP synthase assembly protein I
LKKKKKEDRYWMMRQIGLLTMIPMLLAVSPIIGLIIGSYLDKKLGTGPIFTIVLLVIGFIAGARQVANVVRKAQKEYKNENDADGI